MSRAIKPDLPARLQVNNQIVPDDIPNELPIRTVPDAGVVDAFYPYPMSVTNATDDIDMSVWGWNEQGRYLQQMDKLRDETSKKR